MASRMGFLKPIKTHRVEDRGEDQEEPLSLLARVFHTPQVNCFIVTVFGCKTKIDVDVFKHGLMHSLVKHPRFSSKLVFDEGQKVPEPVAWVRTTVSIDDHVIVPDLDPNMDSPDQFVEDYASNITKTSMDMSKPLWELHILNVKTSEADSIGIFRIHHSLGDGISIVSLVLACTRKVSDPNALPTVMNAKKKMMKKPKANNNSQPWFLRYLLGLMLILKVCWNTLVDVALFIATMIRLQDTKNPLNGGIGIEQAPRRFVHRILNFDDFKLVKNSMGMTINDVAQGVAQAGLSRYIHGRDGTNTGRSNMLKHNLLRATVFVNLRPTPMVEDLGQVINADSKLGWDWGNKIGYALCPINIELKDRPFDYIRDAKAAMDQKKLSFGAHFTSFVTKLLLNTLGLRAAMSVVYKSLSNTTLSFSNVPGPMDEISFYGHPMVFFAPSLYGFPQALVIHFQSYMDKMALVISVDEDAIPDPHKLCDEIEKSLILAKNAVVGRKLY